MLQNYQPRRNIKSFRPQLPSKRPEKAKGGGDGREFVYRAIVERHFGKHTGLPHSAKACPRTMLAGRPAAGLAGRGPGVLNSATARGARTASIRERAYGSFVRAGPERQAGARNRAASDGGKQGNEFAIR